ncbi:hypothetical protein ACFPRL_15350 [Pseudoclavibacter helvolus]
MTNDNCGDDTQEPAARWKPPRATYSSDAAWNGVVSSTKTSMRMAVPSTLTSAGSSRKSAAE